jgi:putative hemolysin
MLKVAGTIEAGAWQRLSVRLAHAPSEVVEAQRLRYRIFAEEMGARLPGRTPGIDQDIFDPYCDHLIVRDADAGRIVGTYRLLAPHQARRIGGYYSETEFDLLRLRNLRDSMVEIGRSCIDTEYRTGAVISLLWSGIAGYMLRNRYDYLIGCASLSMADGGRNATALYQRLGDHYAPPEYRVFPRCRLPIESLDGGIQAEPPPLVKGYLRAGAWVCGEPAWDPDFNTADLLLLLPMARISGRYSRHFIERNG